MNRVKCSSFGAVSFTPLFETLDMLEHRLGSRRYLLGRARPKRTGASSRPWCASMRFTTATSSATCGASSITEPVGLHRDLYQVPGVAETVNLAHIKRLYYARSRNDQSDSDRADRPRDRFHVAASPRSSHRLTNPLRSPSIGIRLIRYSSKENRA